MKTFNRSVVVLVLALATGTVFGHGHNTPPPPPPVVPASPAGYSITQSKEIADINTVLRSDASATTPSIIQFKLWDNSVLVLNFTTPAEKFPLDANASPTLGGFMVFNGGQGEGMSCTEEKINLTHANVVRCASAYRDISFYEVAAGEFNVVALDPLAGVPAIQQPGFSLGYGRDVTWVPEYDGASLTLPRVVVGGGSYYSCSLTQTDSVTFKVTGCTQLPN